MYPLRTMELFCSEPWSVNELEGTVEYEGSLPLLQ